MSNPSALGAICYEAESSWAEIVQTYATFRLPIIGAVDISGLTHDSQAPGRLEQYKGAGGQWVKMCMGGSFSMTLDLTGHGSTMAGSPSLEQIETFLGIVFGNAALSLATSQTCTGGTIAVPTMSGATGVSAGGLVRIGALGDGDGNGQFYSVATHAGSALTLHGELDGAPANGAVVYPVAQIYPSSAATSSAITGTRFLLHTANDQVGCHGCYPMSVSFTGLNTGERPQMSITWGVSWWEYDDQTFPSAVTCDQFNPAPVAAGSFNVQTIGTTTRNARSIRGFSLEYNLATMAIEGPGGVHASQKVIGATRGDHSVAISWTEDADANTLTPTLPGYWSSTNSKYVVYTLSTTNGSAVGFKFPKVCFKDPHPSQKAENDRNRRTINAQAYTSDTTTSALTLASMVMGWA